MFVTVKLSGKSAEDKWSGNDAWCVILPAQVSVCLTFTTVNCFYRHTLVLNADYRNHTLSLTYIQTHQNQTPEFEMIPSFYTTKMFQGKFKMKYDHRSWCKRQDFDETTGYFSDLAASSWFTPSKNHQVQSAQPALIC